MCACKSQTCVYVYLTLVLWLVISGNPSTSQSKKTIKQRFLKLLPCCKPSTTPSISQSKCSFTLYMLSPTCLFSQLRRLAQTLVWIKSHQNIQATHKSTYTLTDSRNSTTIWCCGLWVRAVFLFVIWGVCHIFGYWNVCVLVFYIPEIPGLQYRGQSQVKANRFQLECKWNKKYLAVSLLWTF